LGELRDFHKKLATDGHRLTQMFLCRMHRIFICVHL
jgi:hypothetical protein